MNQIRFTVLYVLGCVTLCAAFLGIVGCTGAPQIDGKPAIVVATEKLAELGNTIAGAAADSTVTQEEATSISAAFKEVGQVVAVAAKPAGVDWAATAGTVISSVIATLTGIRFIPNSLILGSQEAAAVNKVAGIKG